MRWLLLVSMLLVSACQKQADDFAPALNPVNTPPSPAALENATYFGINDSQVTLVDGEWQGEPYVEGGAARPSVGLAKNFSLQGDVDGDGSDEAVVLLWTSSGGSGTFDYIAVIDRDADGNTINTGTAPLGDRVKVRSARITNGRLIFEVVQAGPNDAACCPGQKVRRTFALEDTGLVEVATEDQGRVFPDPITD